MAVIMGLVDGVEAVVAAVAVAAVQTQIKINVETNFRCYYLKFRIL